MGGGEDDASLVVTGAYRLVGRTDAISCFDVEKILYYLVLERVESDDPEPATRLQVADDYLQPFSQRAQLVVDLYAQCLEGPRGGVDAPRPAPARDDPTDEFAQLPGSAEAR